MPPPPLPRDEAFFFVFAFKICLPHQSATPYLSKKKKKKIPGSADQCLHVDQSTIVILKLSMGRNKTSEKGLKVVGVI